MLSSAQRALVLPVVVDNVIGHALRRRMCLAADLRLVNKAFNESVDARIWKDIWMCDFGHTYGPIPALCASFNLQAMLARRPALCQYTKAANFEMAGPHLQFRLELIPRAQNMTWLSVNGIEVLAEHWSRQKFSLPNLKSLRFDVKPVDGDPVPVRQTMKDFLLSLTSVTTLSVFTTPLHGDFFPLSDYKLHEVLDGTAPHEGVADRIEVLALLLSPINTCTRQELAELLATFKSLRGLRLDLPAEIALSDLAAIFPQYIERFDMRCGPDIMPGILEDLADPEKLPMLRRLPKLDIHGIEEGAPVNIPSALVERALAGLAKRAKMRRISSKEREKFRALVLEQDEGHLDNDESDNAGDATDAEGELQAT